MTASKVALRPRRKNVKPWKSLSNKGNRNWFRYVQKQVLECKKPVCRLYAAEFGDKN